MLAVQRKTRLYPVLLPDLGPHRGPAPRRRGRYSVATQALAVAVLLVAPAVFYVSQRAHAARTGYEILQLRQEVSTLQQDNARLLAMATKLRSLERVERIATRELGMRRPGAGQLTSIAAVPPATAAITPDSQSVWSKVSAWLGLREAEAHTPKR